MAGYFLDSPHMCSVGPDDEGYEQMWGQLGDVWEGLHQSHQRTVYTGCPTS